MAYAPRRCGYTRFLARFSPPSFPDLSESARLPTAKTEKIQALCPVLDRRLPQAGPTLGPAPIDEARKICGAMVNDLLERPKKETKALKAFHSITAMPTEIKGTSEQYVEMRNPPSQMEGGKWLGSTERRQTKRDTSARRQTVAETDEWKFTEARPTGWQWHCVEKTTGSILRSSHRVFLQLYDCVENAKQHGFKPPPNRLPSEAVADVAAGTG